jgi:hypothetical protein
VEAIIRDIEPVLRDGLDARRYAEGLMEEADVDERHFEVRGLHTRTGNPHAFTIHD